MSSASSVDSPVLVVGPAWIGDMVMAQSLFGVLAARLGNPPVDVLAPRWCSELLGRMPDVRHTVTMPLGHGELAPMVRRRIGRELRTTGYAQAIVLPNSLKSALVPWFAGIPRRTGWRGEMRYGLLNDMRHLDPGRLPLMVERFVALGVDADAPLPEIPRPRLRADTVAGAALRGSLGLDPDRPVLACCPGAEFGPTKRWPESHFAAVAAQAIGAGMQVWLFGSGGDREVCAAIRAALDLQAQAHCSDLAGRTTLGDAIDLLSCARVVLSNDTGLMHVAAALGRPLVVVYGGSSPRFTPPLVDAPELFTSSLACVPCFARTCRYGHYRCLWDQRPGPVAAAVLRLAAC